uniref:RRM domain-containing protein n=1 Tax=Picocystis salinarum TaxID=88271 RepID=A0A6U9Q094_9CHLO
MEAKKEGKGSNKEGKGRGRIRRRTALKHGETVEPPKAGHVIYIGHIPHGFYEDQMKEYFSQFGKVTRIRLSRNKKTGKSKHYAFVEFGNAEVAEIAAQAMNGYMMFTQRLDTHIMKDEDLHPELFKGANQKFKVLPRQRLEREKLAQPKTAEQVKKNLDRLQKKDNKRRRKLQEAGIEYDFEGVLPGAHKRTKKEGSEDQPIPEEIKEIVKSTKTSVERKRGEMKTAQEKAINRTPKNEATLPKAPAKVINTAEMPQVTNTASTGDKATKGMSLVSSANRNTKTTAMDTQNTPKARGAVSVPNDFKTPEARIIAKRSPKTRAAKAARAAATADHGDKMSLDTPAIDMPVETPVAKRAARTPAAKKPEEAPAAKGAARTPAAKKPEETPATRKSTATLAAGRATKSAASELEEETPARIAAKTPSKGARTASSTKTVPVRKKSFSPPARRVTRSQVKQ